MKTEKLYQPLMRRLPDAGHDNYYAVTDKQSRVLLAAIRLLLDKFEPIGDDYRHGLWIEVPRGKPSDWGSFKEAKDCYEEVKTKEDYLKYWQEEFPRVSYWYHLTISQYDGHTYLFISEHDMHWCCIHDDSDWNRHSIGPLDWYLGPLFNFLKEKVADIVKDPEAYNRYVEEHLPKRQRTGSIPRKDMNRIVPWQRRVPMQLEKGIQVLRECAANEAIYKQIKEGKAPDELPPFYREPMDEMSIRIFSKYFRVAHEVFDSQHEPWSERDREEREERRKEDAQLDDIAYYRRHSLGHYGAITDETDFDSATEFERIANDHYGELGFSRMDVHATDYYTPGKWLITFGFSYSAYIADAVDIAVALYETSCPLIIHDAQKILNVLEEKDNVLLTAYTFHDYFCHHDEGSVFSLPYECYLDLPDELTRAQYDEIVSLAHWGSEVPVVLDTPVPLDSLAYDLIRDIVQEPLTVCGILSALQKKYDKLVFGIMTKGSRCYCYLIEHCEPQIRVEDKRLFPTVNGALYHAIVKYTEIKKESTMIPTREQFKEFMAFVQNAQEKEDKVNDAFELIWDDEQAQHVPFYISPWWKVVRYAFCLLFNLKSNKLGIDDVLEWWMEEAPKGEAKYWIDEKEYNVSDIDVFYDYLAEMSIEPNKKQNNELQFQSRAYILHFGHPFQSREHYQVLQPAIQGCRTYE